MTYSKKDLERRMEGALASLSTEFSGLRTGRASVNLLDAIQVPAYGSTVPLSQVASVSVTDMRMLSVNVWDKTVVGATDRAIRESQICRGCQGCGPEHPTRRYGYVEEDGKGRRDQ